MEQEGTSKIRVLVVDDHGIIRAAMRSMIEGEADVEMVGEASRGEEALDKARLLRPDVVLMDIAMPGMNGIEATRRLTAELPATRVVILTMHEDEEFVLSALRAGAKGYVLKESEPKELLAAIRTVAKGLAYLPPAATKAVVEELLQSKKKPEEEAFRALTPREQEVLRLAASGRSNREIAAALFLSMRTVEKHRQSVMHKLGFTRREDLTKYAIRNGLIDIGTSSL